MPGLVVRRLLYSHICTEKIISKSLNKILDLNFVCDTSKAFTFYLTDDIHIWNTHNAKACHNLKLNKLPIQWYINGMIWVLCYSAS